jgi:hypothetical protein
MPKKQTGNKKIKPRKGGGGKLSRSEIVQVRLDPKLRIAADLAARIQRRTLSSFIEWSVAESVSKIKVGYKENETASFISNKIWDPNELQRFINLKKYYPHLLTYEEESLWNLLVGNQSYWAADKDLHRDLEGNDPPRNLNVPDKLFKKFKDCSKGNMSEEELIKLIIDTIKNFPDDYIDAFYKDYPYKDLP